MSLPTAGIAANALPLISNVTTADSLLLVPQAGGGPGLLTIASLGTALMPSSAVRKTVFIGGVGAGFVNLANPAMCSQLLACGNVGLYEHANGMSALSTAQRMSLWQTWGLTGVSPTGSGQAVGEVGGPTPVDAGYLSYFGGQYPDEVNMNVVTGVGDGSGTYTAGSGDAKPGTQYTGFVTSTDLANVKASIQAAITAGAKNVAVFLTPNGGGEDLDDPFATAPFWANARAIALYGGGLALDVPPSYWLARGAAYQAFVAQMIVWAKSMGIRSCLTVSPYAVTADASGHTAGAGYDPNFLANIKALITYLKRAGALPSQWVVENYSIGGTENDVANDNTAGSLNEAALFIARTVTAAPAGNTGAGVNNIADMSLLSSPRSNLPLALSNVAGVGTMATQDNDQVTITGGTLNGAIYFQTSVTPLFLQGIIVQGQQLAFVLDGNHTNIAAFERPDQGELSVQASGFIADSSVIQSGTGANFVAVPANLGSAYQVRPTVNAAPTWQVSSIGNMEIGSTTAVQSTYIDFHATGQNNDYDARILVVGGAGGASGTSEMVIYAGVVLFNSTFLNAQWPTSAAGLAPGTIWCDTANGRVLKAA